jgi:AraC family transcriptional regulator
VLSKRPKEDPKAIAQYERLLPALKFLDSAEGAVPSLQAIAKKVSLSPEHFHRLFRKVFHMTPFRYVIARRMTRARQLFAEARYSVSEVAQKCGYDDPFYFSRVFRQYYGVTPSQTKGSKRIHVIP